VVDVLKSQQHEKEEEGETNWELESSNNNKNNWLRLLFKSMSWKPSVDVTLPNFILMKAPIQEEDKVQKERDEWGFQAEFNIKDIKN